MFSLPEWFLTPPGSTIFIFLFSLAISLLISGTQKLLTDTSQLMAWRREIAEWTSKYQAALKSRDKKRIEKLKKKEARIMDLQKKTLWHSMKVSIIFFIPILLIWQFFLIPIFGGAPVAYLPGFGPLDLGVWYIICSFTCSTLIQKALGLTPSLTE